MCFVARCCQQTRQEPEHAANYSGQHTLILPPGVWRWEVRWLWIHLQGNGYRCRPQRRFRRLHCIGVTAHLQHENVVLLPKVLGGLGDLF